MQPLAITSLTNPRLKALIRLQDHKERRETGLFVAEGSRAVSRALAANLRVAEAWVCPALMARSGLDGQNALAGLQALPGVAWVEASADVFRKACYLGEPEGLLAVCEVPVFSLGKAPPKNALLLVAVGTEKPGNLGAMVRTADAAGAAMVLAAGAPVDAMNPNAIRASTGAVFSVPTVGVGEEEAISWLLRNNMRILAAYPQGLPGFPPISHVQADYQGAVALVIGPEDSGLSQAWAAAAQQSGGACIAIPMLGQVTDSLNASVAAAVVLFEAVRQRSRQ